MNQENQNETSKIEDEDESMNIDQEYVRLYTHFKIAFSRHFCSFGKVVCILYQYSISPGHNLSAWGPLLKQFECT